MTDAEAASRVTRNGWAIISGEPAPGSRTDPTSSRYWRDKLNRAVNGVDVDVPIPYTLTLTGRLQAVFWRLELETDATVWRIARPRLHKLLADHFGDQVADEVLNA